MRVLVTGATGCIGRHIVPVLLSRGWEVHAVSSRPQPAAADGVTWHVADLLDATRARQLAVDVRASHLLHLAWYIAPGKWAAAPENYAWVEASLALVRAFRDAGGQRVVVSGSCLEYDWRYGYCTEGLTPHTPHTFYGVCKHALQTVISGYSAVTGLSSAWGRVFFLYGPHEHPDRLVAAITRALVSGELARSSHGNQIRDYLFVHDVADAFVALLESDVTGPINLASGRAITLRTIIERLGTLTERSDLLRIGAIPAAPTDTPLVVADTTRATRELRWQPRVDLDEGLSRTIAWWREELARTGAHTR
jgi:nucleoside-diphosphate-sugar epimerase